MGENNYGFIDIQRPDSKILPDDLKARLFQGRITSNNTKPLPDLWDIGGREFVFENRVSESVTFWEETETYFPEGI